MWYGELVAGNYIQDYIAIILLLFFNDNPHKLLFLYVLPWQVFYVLAAVGGGAFSALSSNSIGTAQGPNIATAIFGGICLLLGARLAAGCTRYS